MAYKKTVKSIYSVIIETNHLNGISNHMFNYVYLKLRLPISVNTTQIIRAI